MSWKIHEENDYRYLDEGQGPIMLLLHGLFGALSNWDDVIRHFSGQYRVVIPMLPVYDLPVRKAGLENLNTFLEKFVATKELDNMVVMGNSLGGHIGLLYTLSNPNRVDRLILTGSSGLFENSMGGSFPKRGSYEYIKERVEYTFFDPATIGKEYVNEVFEITNSISKCLSIVSIAKSAQRHNMAEELHKIKVPTLLVWGLNDTITPPMVGYEFNRLIANSRLRFIDRCCHAPMMENPERFNQIVEEFLTLETTAV